MRWAGIFFVSAFVAASAFAGRVLAQPAAPGPAADELTPPSVATSVPPLYPPLATSNARVIVTTHVVLDAAGAVTEARVTSAPAAGFDDEALRTVRLWQFVPAKRNGVAIASAFSVEVVFEAPPAPGPVTESPPAAPTPAAPPPVPAQPAPAQPAPALTGAADEAKEFSATGATTKVTPPRSASDFVVEREVLEAAPHHEAADMLRAVPGLYVARPEGDAVAHRVSLRGFDADHGQDIAFSVSGVPLNQPSHLHGQGYADLGFIIPETVRAIRVREGVYDPLQGDFAIAGSVDFDLGVTERGLLSRTTYGSFNTLRQLLLWAPEGQSDETFAGATYRETDGFGQNRASRSGGAMAQYEFGTDWKTTFTGWLHGARGASAGVLRRDDVEGGTVDYYDVYPLATARAQSASSSQAVLAAHLEREEENGTLTEAGLWLGTFDFRSQTNFTGFTRRSTVNPEWVGRGDLVEQSNRDLALGFHARHRTAPLEPFEWTHIHLELGTQARLDHIDQSQNLLESPQNQTWDRLVDADITAADVGAWVDIDAKLTDYVQVHGGVRGDVLFYDVNDALGNFIPAFRGESYIPGYRRSAFGLAAGPRLSVTVTPAPWLKLLGAYGQGFRSPQARQLEDGETAPFAKVHSGDIGARVALGPDEEFTATLAGYATTLSDDVAFDPGEARLERIGPTTRMGGVLYLIARPWRGWISSLSATYVHATLDAPPPPSAEDPSPAFKDGQLLPYVAPWVLRLDSKIEEPVFELGGHPVLASVGAGASYLSPRPLPFGAFARPIAVLDASLGLRWRYVEFTVEGYNLFDVQYAANEYSFASNWSPDSVPSKLPARHLTAGSPLTVLATLGLRL